MTIKVFHLLSVTRIKIGLIALVFSVSDVSVIGLCNLHIKSSIS